MKQIIALPIIALLLFSCGENVEKKAELKLQAARQTFEQGNFSGAKSEIDSIKILYPKAFNARKEAIRLLQQIELEEQQLNIAHLDSLLEVRQIVFEAIKGKFVLEKDPEYQNIGNYFWPTQTVEKNLHRSFLRFQVSEKGIMSITSIYCGPSNIHHIAVKVIAPDGSFAETPASNDSYETSDMGEKIEKADYQEGQDGNVIGFIYLNRDKNLRLEYLGEKKYATTMSASDRQALKEIYEFSRLISSIEQAKKEKEEANLKIRFLKRKMEDTEK